MQYESSTDINNFSHIGLFEMYQSAVLEREHLLQVHMIESGLNSVRMENNLRVSRLSRDVPH